MSSTAKFKSWISAARLRTLPLSISGIIMGSSCAYLIGSSPIYIDMDSLNPTFLDPSFKVEVLFIGLLDQKTQKQIDLQAQNNRRHCLPLCILLPPK